MIQTISKTALALALVVAIVATEARAQVCPPTPSGFNGLTGIPQSGQTDNGAVLDFLTGNDSSDAVNGDNTAEAYQTEPIAIQFGSPRVPAGQPLSICFSVGIPGAPQTTPVVDGDIWLDISGSGNFYTIIDGLGLTKPFPDIFGVTPGPNNLYTLFAAVTGDPGALGACVTFQTILLDPYAPSPFFVTFSNPIAFGVAPGFRSIQPNVQSPGGVVTCDVPGAGAGDVVIFQPNMGVGMNASKQVNVPAGALSGQVTGLVSVWNTQGSLDGLNDFVAVTNINPPFQAAGALAPVPNANFTIPGMTRASAIGALPNATTADTWTISLNAGDILDVEIYSTDFVGQSVLDGNGNFFNPFAQEGFDPFVTLQIASNPDNLVFDPATSIGINLAAPFNLQFDDNSGPENNARLRWQAKWAGTYNIVVGCAVPAGFATGTYLINAVVTPGAPCVQRFNVMGAAVSTANRRNVVPQAGQIDLICANVTVGNNYTIDLIPKAGAPFLSRTVTGITATTANRLTLTVPGVTAGCLPLGLHQIRLRDDTTQLQGLIWDNSAFTPFTGILPDLLCIRGVNSQLGINTNTVGGNIVVGALNAESIFFPSAVINAASLNNFFVSNWIQANDPGGSSVAYCEALGVDENINDLMDTVEQLNIPTTGQTGIYNPAIQSWAYSLLNPSVQNDDDGVLPANLFPAPMGIGFNAAVIDTVNPLFNPAGGPYFFFIDELVLHGPFQNHAFLVNVVIQ